MAMGYRLQMSAEIYDWLAELRGSDPPAAALAAQALAALAADGDRLGPPLVPPWRAGCGQKSCCRRWTGAIRPAWSR